MRNTAHIWLGVLAWVLFGIAMILAIVSGAMSEYDDAKPGVAAWASGLEMAAYPFIAAWIAVFAIRWKPVESVASVAAKEPRPWVDAVYRDWLAAKKIYDTPVARDRFASETGSILPTE